MWTELLDQFLALKNRRFFGVQFTVFHCDTSREGYVANRLGVSGIQGSERRFLVWKTAFLDKLLVKVFSSLSFHLFIWFEGVRKVFGVFCAGSSHVKNTRLKIFLKYEYTVVSSSSPFFFFFPTRTSVLKPREKSWPLSNCLTRAPVPLLLVPELPTPDRSAATSCWDSSPLGVLELTSTSPVGWTVLISSVHLWNLSFLVYRFLLLSVY